MTDTPRRGRPPKGSAPKPPKPPGRAGRPKGGKWPEAKNCQASFKATATTVAWLQKPENRDRVEALAWAEKIPQQQEK